MARKNTAQKRMQDPLVRKVHEASKLSFSYCTKNTNGNGSPFEKANRAAAAYERIIDYANWQTRSEVYMPYALAATEQALAMALQQLYTDEDWLDLVPRGVELDAVQVETVREYLMYTLRGPMQMWLKGYKTIKDALKLGCGYGLVEAEYITPWKFREILIQDKNMTITDLMEDFDPELVVTCKNLNFAQVMPSPGGGATPDERDWVIVIQFVDEEKLEFMNADDNSAVDCSMEEIRKDALDNQIDGYHVNPFNLMKKFTTENNGLMDNRNAPNAGEFNLPVKIPIIKYMGRDEEIWIANGRTTIMHVNSGPQLLHKPLVKAAMRIEGDEWFADGIISSNEDVFDADNILTNVIMDMVDFNSRPRMIRDSRMGEINMEPWGQTMYHGPMDQQPFYQMTVGGSAEELGAIMNRLDHARQIGNHQSDAMQGAPQSGVMRGGSGAVESLLQNTSAVPQITGKLLDIGFTKDVAIKTLFLLQTMSQEEETEYEMDQFNDEGKRQWKVKTITRDDLLNDFRVEISSDDKYRNTAMEYQKRLNQMQFLASDPSTARMLNPMRKLEYVLESRRLAQKLTAGADPREYDIAVATLAGLTEMAKNQASIGVPSQAPSQPASNPTQRGRLGGGAEGDQAQQAQQSGVPG